MVSNANPQAAEQLGHGPSGGLGAARTSTLPSEEMRRCRLNCAPI